MKVSLWIFARNFCPYRFMSGFFPEPNSHREYPTVEFVSPLTPFTQSEYPMASAEQGTFQALRLMTSAVLGECPPDFSGFRDEFNIRAAIKIVNSSSGANERHGLSKIAALFCFVRDN